jgi:hypothetical protein
MTASLEKTDRKGELSRSFAYIEKALTKQTILVIAFLILSTFITLLDVFQNRFPAAIAKIAVGIVVLFLASHLIREVYSDGVDEERRQAPSWQSGTPILSLGLLWVLYYTAFIVLTLMLVAPGIWWATTSCLAIVSVVIEDKGAIDALKRSHELVKGKFKEVFIFMLPAVLLSAVAMIGIGSIASYGLKFLEGQGYAPLVLLASALIFGLLNSAFWLMSNLIIFAYLTRLFIRLTGNQVEPVDS